MTTEPPSSRADHSCAGVLLGAVAPVKPTADVEPLPVVAELHVVDEGYIEYAGSSTTRALRLKMVEDRYFNAVQIIHIFRRTAASHNDVVPIGARASGHPR